jgi:hypothetical protein
VTTERCDDPECMICYPLVTRTGRVLSEDDIQALADEAEHGYDIGVIKERKRNDDTGTRGQSH